MALRGCDPVHIWEPIALVVIGQFAQYSFPKTTRAIPLFLASLLSSKLKNQFMANFRHAPYLM